jgi:hypothetical protein
MWLLYCVTWRLPGIPGQTCYLCRSFQLIRTVQYFCLLVLVLNVKYFVDEISVQVVAYCFSIRGSCFGTNSIAKVQTKGYILGCLGGVSPSKCVIACKHNSVLRHSIKKNDVIIKTRLTSYMLSCNILPNLSFPVLSIPRKWYHDLKLAQTTKGRYRESTFIEDHVEILKILVCMG